MNPFSLPERLRLSAFLLLLVFASAASGQFAYPEKAPDGGGAAPMPTDEITDAQRRSIWTDLNANIAKLEREGILQPASPQVTLFRWPLAKAPGRPEFNLEGISNFVDQNAAFPNQLMDYNCGARTYDQASGYNHAGIDMFTWPFGWKMLDDSAAQIVAAAAGTIILKADGNFDRNCGFGSGNWNAVYVRHADNSVAWYGHMKNGSLTAKPVGATVAAGEYLGVVGSSGNSTGPHLHFEIYSATGQLQEPYQGACNAMNAFTWWEAQEPYRNSRMNRLMTHSAGPVFPTCPTTETTNEKNAFRPGEPIVVAGYFRDAVLNQQTQYSLIQPNGTVANSWSHNSPQIYNASYWFWTISTTPAIPRGRWRIRAIFNGQEYNHYFNIGKNVPSDFDGDGRTDVSLWRPTTGTWYAGLSSNSTMYVQPWGLTGDKIVPADYDGDGRTDLAVRRPSDNNFYVFNSSNSTVEVRNFGIVGDVPIPADYNADGKADVAVWRPSNGTWYLSLSGSGIFYVMPWGFSTDKPAPADFDGDGSSELAVFRPSDGKWYSFNTVSGTINVTEWGVNGDLPVQGDYNGDGRADYAVYRPSNNTWYRQNSNDGAVSSTQWGLAGDFVVPGDYDGDGRSDVAVWRPSDATWYVNRSGSGLFTQTFGLLGDTPSASAFVF